MLIRMIDLYYLGNPEQTKRVPMPAPDFLEWPYASICQWCKKNHHGWRLADS